MKLIVFFIHDGLRRNLFLSLSRKAIDKKYDVKIYCFSLSEYVWFCKKGLAKHVHLLKTCKTKKINKYELVTNSIDVIAGFLNKDDALEIYFAVFHELDSLKNKEYEEIIVFGGNGLHAFDKAITGFSENNQKVKTLFTELSNIDGKLFVDRKGSNASSEYYRLLCSGLALKKSAGSFDLAEWRNDYVNKKKDSHIIKQAPENKKIRRIIHRGLGIVEFFCKLPSYQRFKISEYLFSDRKLIPKIYAEQWAPYSDDISKLDGYIFFPMQVFGDSQIKLHSKIDNEKAIELVSQKAKANNIPLVIKPHPAEFDINALHTVIKLKEQYNFYISSENTFSLIMKSKMVTVINSTVGLEAILCGKDVDFLGDSFYQYFQDDDFLRYYINDWLIEYDIFCTNKIYLTDEQFNKFLSRADATVIV